MRERDLIPFLVITFLIAWLILGLYIFATETMTGLFGELTGKHPLFYIAVYSPAIAALALVYHRHGLDGIRHFLSRLLLWRTSIYWYAFLLVVVPLVFYVAALFKGHSDTVLFPFDSLGAYLLALLLMAIKGPLEEIGWRGFALPLLQRLMTPLSAALILGSIWAIWHLPAFLLSGTPQSAWSLFPFLAGTVALSVIVTALFNHSKGSILLAAFFHLQLINPLWPDAQPYDSGLFIAIAVIIVWLKRSEMLSHQGGITDVLAK